MAKRVGSLSCRNRISLHDITIWTTPAVESKEEIQSSGWYSQVKLRGDVQLTGANAQLILLSWKVEREVKDPKKTTQAFRAYVYRELEVSCLGRLEWKIDSCHNGADPCCCSPILARLFKIISNPFQNLDLRHKLRSPNNKNTVTLF